MPCRYRTAELRLVVTFEQNDFAACYNNIPARCESTDPVMRIRLGHYIIDIDKSVLGELRIKLRRRSNLAPTGCRLSA